MVTREELAALSDQELNERVAKELMGWQQRKVQVSITNRRGRLTGSWHDETHWIPPDDGPRINQPLPYSRSLSYAWQVVQRIMRIPESKAEASVAANTRFLYAFKDAAPHLVCSSEAEAARWICTEALLAWYSGPLFPPESEG